MPVITLSSEGGINNNINPIQIPDGQLIRAYNVDSDPLQAKTKRWGYNTILGTPDNSQITTLFDWHPASGSTFFYRASGSSLYYSTQGTGAWTLGTTIANGGTVAHAILNDVLFIADGSSPLMYSTTGTSFGTMTAAPLGPSAIAQFQGRIYTNGTTTPGSNLLYYSAAASGTDWNTAPPDDSSQIGIPGNGSILTLQSISNILTIGLSAGDMLYWDGQNVVDLSTKLGPTSLNSLDILNGYSVWQNRLGVTGFEGVMPTTISSPVQKYFYGRAGSAVSGTAFNSMPSAIYRYDYYSAMGSVTDSFTGITIQNMILKYGLDGENDFLTWQFNDNPTAMAQVIDGNNNLSLIFGNAQGQVFKAADSATSDNGQPIEAVMEFMVQAKIIQEKDFYWLRMLFNPGCEANVAYAVARTYTSDAQLIWTDIGQVIDGVVEYRFDPGKSRGRYLFLKISEKSTNSPFFYYGCEVEYEVVQRRPKQ